MFAFVKNLFKKISLSGVTPEMDPVFAKRIILTNLLGLLFTINMSASAVAFFSFQYYFLASFTAFFVLTEISWPVLNHFKFYNLSRLGILISSNILGFTVSVLLPDTGYNRGFFVMAGLPILLFGLPEKKSILLGLILPVILYPLSEKVQYLIPVSDFGVVLDPATAKFIELSIGIIYVLLIFLMFLFLSRENARAESQLAEQKARAFSAAKFAAVGEMAGGIAHEINNPMTVIALNTDQIRFMIKDKNPDFSRVDHCLNNISKTVKRVSNIIDSMKSFSRDGSSDPFSKQKIKPIIDETFTFCKERFKNQSITLEVKYSSEDIELNCRAVQISQVLLNLLNNSFDAIIDLEEKWVRVEVSEHQGIFQMSVIDSGRGINPADQEKIFLPFFTTKSVGKGTGLGLSVSKKIIEDHNGKLTLDASSPNTKFDIEI